MRNETNATTPAPRISDMAGTTREVQRAGIAATSLGGSVQIVLARVEMTGTEFTGRYLDRYQMEREVKAVPVAEACMWLNDGTEEDVAKAVEFANKNGYAVYTFDGEKDPLAMAKARAMEVHNGVRKVVKFLSGKKVKV